MANQRIKANLIPLCDIYPVIHLAQYDVSDGTGKQVEIELYYGTDKFTIPSGSSITFRGTKRDKTGYSYEITKFSDNVVTVDVKPQMTVLSGTHFAELRISKGNTISNTIKFVMKIDSSALADDTKVSETDLSVIEKALQASDAAIQAKAEVEQLKASVEKSEKNAKQSETNASQSATNAQESAENASTSATTASTKATEASTSATKAKESETNAQESAESAIQTKAEVEQLKKETVEQTKTLTDSAKQEISTVKDATVSEVTQLKTDTISDITSIKDRAVEEVTVIKADAKAEADKAKESETNAKMSETNASNSAKEAKASADSVANVVSDVSKLKEDTAALQKRQNVLIGSETGNQISCDDAFAAPLCGLHIYGKSTQDGTPTPDAPVPIASVGDGGSVVVKVNGRNILDMRKSFKSVKGVGVTYTRNADYSFTRTGTSTDITGNLWLAGDYNIAPFPNGSNVFCTLKKGVKYSITGCVLFTKTQAGAKSARGTNFTPTEDMHITGVRNEEFEVGETYNDIVYPAVYVGEKALQYEPYREQLLTFPTPNGLPGIPVNSGGNYTDQSGQQWACDEVDLARGVKVQRVNRLKLDDLPWRYELTPTNKNDTFISTVSASQYGTDRGFSLCQYAVFDGVAYDIEMAENCRCYVWINSATIQFKTGLGVNSLDAFSEWLKARPDASIYYCLATPKRNHAYSC